jgi:aromatic ring-opening dioxygenase LigB subunit
VASADQGHAHDAGGPYGFHPASTEFDTIVKKAVVENDLTPMMSLSPQFVEDAKPDSLWQLAMLQGVLEHTEMTGRLLSYQVPTYFGMLCALYLPKQKHLMP